MKIREFTSRGGRDFSAIMECEHCAHLQEVTTGYNDAYYHQHVIPAMTCRGCGKNRAGEIPAEPNDIGVKHVEASTSETRIYPGGGTIATWCPECCPHVATDEDGCCTSCGATATGKGADTAADLLEALKGLYSIVENTRGVDGHHLNGDIAAWDEFEEVEIARAAVAKAEGHTNE